MFYRKLTQPLYLFLALTFAFTTSCVVIDDDPGPPGRPGNAFFGVDYADYVPYSYWDNNPSIPHNPVLGQYYRTHPGIYEFEYFINPHEYWYGTYELWINPGGPGRPYGEPGLPGPDSYLMLIGDRFGMHEHRTNKNGSPQTIVFEDTTGQSNFRLEMQLTTVEEREPQDPKIYFQQ